MSCVTSFVIFAILTQRALSTPISSNSTTSTIDSIRRMGQAIEELPSGSAHIKSLNLAYNHLSTLPECIFHNKSYESLLTIELYQNKITYIHMKAFRELKQLSTVVLSDNNITSIDPYTFKFNPKLTKLDLSRNKIVFYRLKVFLVSSSLETLVLKGNEIEQIFELTFMGVPNLKNLILDDNILYTIATDSFKSLNKLQYLSLANTGVDHLSKSMFGNNLPTVIDVEETPLASKFDPPLKKVTKKAVRSLININTYNFTSDLPF